MKKKLSFVNIVFFVVFGVLTGVLWAYLCPIPLIPGAVHFRTFAFIPVAIGYLFGPVTGFSQATSEPSYGLCFPVTSFPCIPL